MDYSVKVGNEQLIIERDSKRIADDVVDQLVEYRKQLKMTQQEVADATGIKRANIARIETKRNEVSLDSLIRIAGSMGLKLSFKLEKMEQKERTQ